MKILIDIDVLQQEGVVTPELAATLRMHAARDTGGTAINVLLAFGALAVAAGLMALLPSIYVAALLGAGFMLLGMVVVQRHPTWSKLGHIWVVVGTLMFCGAVGVLIYQPMLASLAVALILTLASIKAESKLLMMLVPFAISSAIGGSTGYWSAVYSITIREATLTIAIFSLLAYAGWQWAQTSKGMMQDLAIVFCRTCVVLVNLGFWIGSLWGDIPGDLWSNADRGYSTMAVNQGIPAWVFGFSWAFALLGAGIWGARHGRRFMVNTVAVFGAIHFYTQWFEFLGMQPATVMFAGLATIAFGMGLWRYNRAALGQAGPQLS